jgi:hypothetical protein
MNFGSLGATSRSTVNVTNATRAAGAHRLFARSVDDRRVGAWELTLLAVALATAALYIAIGFRVHEIVDNDGAYYYGVARHMVVSGRFEEPIVWHFVQPPDRVVHAPFDYWGCMTALLLIPPMLLFGATPETAFVTMSAVSAAGVVAFWYLICVVLPLRYRFTQLFALVLFAFSPAMARFRFQPESTVVAQLFVLLSLIAFCRRRYVFALLSGFAILLTRGDGLVLFALIFLAVLVESRSDVDGRSRGIGVYLLTVLTCAGTYVVWSCVSFGTLTPPATQVLPFLSAYPQVFDYGVSHPRSVTRLVHWLDWDYLRERLPRALTWLRWTPFTPASDVWLALAMLPALRRFRGRPRPEVYIWLLCFGGYFLMALVAGPGFHPARAPHTFTPLIILAGAGGLDALWAWLQAWVERGPRERTRALFVGAGMAGLCIFFGSRLTTLHTIPVVRVPVRADLTRLDVILQGQPVASNVPWHVIAHTRSPAVSIPYNGEAAIEAVLQRYQARWMVVFDNPPRWVEGESRAVLQRIASGQQTTLGRLQLQRVEVPASQAVFRVTVPAS